MKKTMYKDATAYTTELISVSQAAYSLNVCNKTVIKYIQQGMLEAHQAGYNCKYLITKSSVARLQGKEIV